MVVWMTLERRRSASIFRYPCRQLRDDGARCAQDAVRMAMAELAIPFLAQRERGLGCMRAWSQSQRAVVRRNVSVRFVPLHFAPTLCCCADCAFVRRAPVLSLLYGHETPKNTARTDKRPSCGKGAWAALDCFLDSFIRAKPHSREKARMARRSAGERVEPRTPCHA